MKRASDRYTKRYLIDILRGILAKKQIRKNKLKERRKRIIHSLEQNPAQKIIYSAMIKEIDKEIEKLCEVVEK